MKQTPWLLLLLLITTGCRAPHTEGGRSSQGIDPEDGVVQTMEQSENPATESSQWFKETTEMLDPDGRVVRRTTREAGTEVGAAQDLAKIMKAVDKNFAGRMVLVLALLGGAYYAWKREWPLISAVLGFGGLAAFQWGSVAAYVSLAAAALIYVAYKIGLKTLPGSELYSK